jgi:hypothetical protein
MGVYEKMREIASILRMAGVKAIIPEPDGDTAKQLTLFDFEEFKRNTSFAYLRKIRDPKTFCVLAVNLDLYKILDYIGPNTFAELAVAFAQSKKMYIYQSIPDAYADELYAWQAIPLRGNLEKLIIEYKRACLIEDSQLNLPIV